MEKIIRELTAVGTTSNEAAHGILPQIQSLFSSAPGFSAEQPDADSVLLSYEKSADFSLKLTIKSSYIYAYLTNGIRQVNNYVGITYPGGSGYIAVLKIALYRNESSFFLDLYANNNVVMCDIGLIKSMIQGGVKYLTMWNANSTTLIFDAAGQQYLTYTSSIHMLDDLLKTDNPFVTVGNAVAGYMDGMTGFVINNTRTGVSKITTDGHTYICQRASPTNMIGMMDT